MIDNGNLLPLNIHFPGRLVFGSGMLNALPADVEKLGSKSVFIVTIPPLLSALSDIIAQLKEKGIAVAIDTSIKHEPSFRDFNQLLVTAKAANPDTIIGIGGGSVLDLAKLVAAPVWRFLSSD